MKHLLMKLTSLIKVRDEKLVYNVLIDACHAAKCKVYATAKHEFYPYGMSAIVIIGESHAAVHTWPEKNLVQVDYFSCAEDPCFDQFIAVWQKASFTIVEQQIIMR